MNLCEIPLHFIIYKNNCLVTGELIFIDSKRTLKYLKTNLEVYFQLALMYVITFKQIFQFI